MHTQSKCFSRAISLVLAASLSFWCFAPVTLKAYAAEEDIEVTQEETLSSESVTEPLEAESAPAAEPEEPQLVALSASDGIIGKLTLIATFTDGEMFFDGHSYLVFTSTADGVELTFTDLYGCYEMTDEFKESVLYDHERLSHNYEPAEDVDSVFTTTMGEQQADDRYRVAMQVYDLNIGEFISIGNYTMAEGPEGQMAITIRDAVLNSTMWEPASSIIESGLIGEATLEQVTGQIVNYVYDFCAGEMTAEETEQAIAQYLMQVITPEAREAVGKLTQDNMLFFDGDTTGGLFVNRELYRQKDFQDQGPNETYTVDVTRQQIDSMLAFLNSGNENHYSPAVHNCSTVAAAAWNAAVGYLRDEDGNNTDERSPLYVQGYDPFFDFENHPVVTPRAIHSTIRAMGEEDLGGTRDQWDIVPAVLVSAPDTPSDNPSNGSASVIPLPATGDTGFYALYAFIVLLVISLGIALVAQRKAASR